MSDLLVGIIGGVIGLFIGGAVGVLTMALIKFGSRG